MNQMKKTIAAILSVMLLSLGGCSTKAPENKAPETPASEQPAAETPAKETASESAAHYPFKIQSGGSELLVEKMPEKAVIFNYDIAEIMSALGLADKIYAFRGGHQTAEDVLPQYRDAILNLKDTEVIAAEKGFPTLENMLSLEPDMVIMPSYYFNNDVFGKKEDYAQNNIPLYITEGTSVPSCTIENTYNDILNIGRIFDREERAAELIEEMKNRVKAVEEKMQGKKKLKVMGLDSEHNGKLVSWGGVGLANDLVRLAGGENIFASAQKQFPHVSWEEVINADPDIIVIAAYEDDNKGQAKVDLLKNNPQTAELNAVKNDRIVIVPLFSVFPGLQNVDTVEAISKAILDAQ